MMNPMKTLRRAVRVARRLGVPGFGRMPAEEGDFRDYYSIAIYEGTSPFDLRPAGDAGGVVLTADDVSDIPATYVADPFMIRHEGVWNMFFEILPADGGKGVIGLATSADGLEWRYRQVVLDEPFHLSYPLVFESDGEHFMVPESHEDGTLRLYRAVGFPFRWEHVGNMLEGGEFVDCTPFRHDGRWWLFVGCGSLPFRADTLRLFHSDHLLGPWTEHPCSPVVSGNASIARPGGRVVEWGGGLFRFTQDCVPRYGLRVRAFEIVELTTETYVERAAAGGMPVLAAAERGWNSSGMHHIDPHRLEDGRCLACVDGWYWGKVRR